MLRVTVELFPHGDASRAETLGVATITNDGTGTLESGNYRARFDSKNIASFRCRVHDFERLTHGPWDLLFLALKEALHPKHE